MSEEDKVRENRLRRKADRMGYRLLKSRRRDPAALEYGGYMIVDVETGGAVAGTGNAGRGYALSLDDVEEWLSSDDGD